MRVNLSGHHVDVTPALRSYAERKLSRILRRFDRVIEVHCVLTVDKLRHRAESTVSVRGPDIHAAAEADDMYAAIDALALFFLGELLPDEAEGDAGEFLHLLAARFELFFEFGDALFQGVDFFVGLFQLVAGRDV